MRDGDEDGDIRKFGGYPAAATSAVKILTKPIGNGGHNTGWM